MAGLAWLTRLGSSAELPAPSGPSSLVRQALLRGPARHPSAELAPGHAAGTSCCLFSVHASCPPPTGPLRIHTEKDVGFGTSQNGGGSLTKSVTPGNVLPLSGPQFPLLYRSCDD